MINLSKGAASVVAGSASSAVNDVDTALASNLRFAADFIDAIKDAGVPAGRSQRVYNTFTSSFTKVIEGRAEMLSAIGQMSIIQRHSNLAEVSWGCPDWLTTHQPEPAIAMTTGDEVVAA